VQQVIKAALVALSLALTLNAAPARADSAREAKLSQQIAGYRNAIVKTAGTAGRVKLFRAYKAFLAAELRRLDGDRALHQKDPLAYRRIFMTLGRLEADARLVDESRLQACGKWERAIIAFETPASRYAPPGLTPEAELTLELARAICPSA
jgi:hypothetical protein